MSIINKETIWYIQDILEHYKGQTENELQGEINKNSNPLRISYLQERLYRINKCLEGL